MGEQMAHGHFAIDGTGGEAVVGGTERLEDFLRKLSGQIR